MEKVNVSDNIFEAIKGFTQSYYELKLTTANKKISNAGSFIAFIVLIVILSALSLFFFAIALASWLSIKLNDTALAYACVGLLLLVIIFILYASRKSLKIGIRNRIIKKIYEQGEDTDI